MQRYLNVEAEMPGNLIEINNEKLEKKRTLTATKDLGN